jgi:hypothetical protein
MTKHDEQTKNPLKLQRRWILKALKDLLIPKLEDAGFLLDPYPHPDKTSFPFGAFRRQKGPNLEQIDIQFLNKGVNTVAFRLSLWIKPLRKLEANESVPKEDVIGNMVIIKSNEWQARGVRFLTGDLCDSFGRWFRVRIKHNHKVNEEDCCELVKRVTNLMPEVEHFFQTKKSSKHVIIGEKLNGFQILTMVIIGLFLR